VAANHRIWCRPGGRPTYGQPLPRTGSCRQTGAAPGALTSRPAWEDVGVHPEQVVGAPAPPALADPGAVAPGGGAPPSSADCSAKYGTGRTSSAMGEPSSRRTQGASSSPQATGPPSERQVDHQPAVSDAARADSNGGSGSPGAGPGRRGAGCAVPASPSCSLGHSMPQARGRGDTLPGTGRIGGHVLVTSTTPGIARSPRSRFSRGRARGRARGGSRPCSGS
jgi:hypothetical protein